MKKKRKRKQRKLLRVYDTAARQERARIADEAITHIRGTLNAISSRLEDLWDYVQQGRTK